MLGLAGHMTAYAAVNIPSTFDGGGLATLRGANLSWPWTTSSGYTVFPENGVTTYTLSLFPEP